MAKKRKKRIASRGSVNNIILKSLIEGDKYGYEIIKDVEKYSNGKIQLKQPSLYSSLSRFEDKGYVSSYWGDSDIGGRRHYYHLTDAGIGYYQRAVLKITDNENEEIEEDDLASIEDNSIIESKEVDPQDEIITEDDNMSNGGIEEKIVTNETNSINLYNQTEYDENDKDNLDEDLDEVDNVDNNNYVVTEIEEDEIPAIVDFPDKEERVTIADHHFYNNTPMEKSIFENTPVVKATPTPPWAELSNSVKLNNKRISMSSNRKFHYIIPKKEKKVILDKDGIYKLRDADYVHTEHKESKPKFIDNVIKRTKDNNIYGYSSYTDKTNETKKSFDTDLTEEEKRHRNEVFVAKFNSLTQSKYEENEKTKDYQEKLNLLMSLNNEEDLVVHQATPTPNLYDDTAIYTEKEPENNLFNYEDETDVEIANSYTEDEDDRFIDFNPEEFETKNENKQYIDEISNYIAPTENVKVSRYTNHSNAILQDKSFVLINKVNCIFGFILAFILFAELTISLFIFKKHGLMFDGDTTLYIVSYVSTTLLALCYILPILFNPNEHKLNNFKLKYAMLFGILTFLICLVLVYCFNTLFGFQLDNIQFFAVKLFVPSILALNFVILPPIYSALIKCRKFYD